MAASDLRAKGAGPGKGAAGPGKDGGAQVRGGASRAKVGRNDPCPCGSGKKHKLCCGG
ncbi:MAG: SEC-C metal-binding domain-containing protein [Oscillospiraceae bacterium]|nr:SEC-C metal-binding domain-containing protein [Oscillospiraceae bacterium]